METTNIRKFFTKNYNKDNSIPFAWYNIDKIITEKGIAELDNYIKKGNGIKQIIVVTNIEETRPQRTWGQLPDWFRPNSEWHCFDKYNYENSFVFIVYEDFTEESILEACKSFPDKASVKILKGDK